MVILTAACYPVDAFDGQREGFFIGVGIGPGIFRSDLMDPQRYHDPEETGSTLSLDLKVGTGVADRLQVYWASKANWVLERRTTFIGSAGLGIRAYLRTAGSGPFLAVTAGYSSWSGEDPWDDDENAGTAGPGWSLSAGYELGNAWDLELSGFVNRLRSGDPEIDVSSFRVTLNKNWY